MMELSGRMAVITGAASGIGRALTEQALAKGMTLALVDHNQEQLDLLVSSLPAHAEVTSACLDVRDREALDAFAVQCKSASIALLFANAGVMRAGPSWELGQEDWSQVFDVNVVGAMNTVSAFMPHLLDQQSPSRVVFTGSISAFTASPSIACYSASKHALWGIAEAMELELQERAAPVAVSFVAPSGVKTPLASEPLQGPAGASQQSIHDLLDRFGVPAESVAQATFDGIAQEKFWILPHPEFKPALQARVARVVEELPPSTS